MTWTRKTMTTAKLARTALDKDESKLLTIKEQNMSNMEERLRTESDEWFAKVKILLGQTPEPEDDWTVLWYDGYTPEEAVAQMDMAYKLIG
jgi:hypothetical protein